MNKKHKNIVVIDLEAIATTKRDDARDILAIGAIKLSKHQRGGYKVVDEFRRYVRPMELGRINNLTREITGISKELVENKLNFKEIIKLFRAWLGVEDCFLCTWANNDFYLLYDNCNRWNVDTSWIKNYNDLQEIYMRKWHPNQKGSKIGLAKALEESGLVFEGHAHNAYFDALNTSKLFQSMLSEHDLECNRAAEDHGAYLLKQREIMERRLTPEYKVKLRILKEISDMHNVSRRSLAKLLRVDTPQINALFEHRWISKRCVEALLIMLDRYEESGMLRK